MQPTSQGNEFAFVTMAVKKKKKKIPLSVLRRDSKIKRKSRETS